ncbi:MAG TPA: manganese-binding transcriptional regulator MntR [Lacipirellulaceae bacterium]|nr:manganese-binding transcriptional regulator MntR [Lacipirellulaceae bacterium]
MPKPASQADPHRRTRSDHATETAEDYAEAIDQLRREFGKCRIVDLARRFAVSHVTVTKVVARLKREGLVTSEPYGPLELTDAGRQLADKSRRQHQIVLEFLQAIGVSPEVAAIDAEGIEHHVSRQTLECFRRLTEDLKSRS